MLLVFLSVVPFLAVELWFFVKVSRRLGSPTADLDEAPASVSEEASE